MSEERDKALSPPSEDGEGESDTLSRTSSGDQPDVLLRPDGDHEPNVPLEVRPASFPPLTPSDEEGAATRDIEFLEDISLEVAVELGRAVMSLRQVLGLAPGVVIELDKLAGEPVDMLVNGKLVGRGEVVIIEDMFGVRVTEIIPPSQRWKYR